MKTIGINYTYLRIKDIKSNTTYAEMCDTERRIGCEKHKMCMLHFSNLDEKELFKKCRGIRFMVEEVR